MTNLPGRRFLSVLAAPLLITALSAQQGAPAAEPGGAALRRRRARSDLQSDRHSARPAPA